jgi:hypothetical protein
MDTPTLTAEDYQDLQQALASGGALTAIDGLCAKLKANDDFQAYFYTRLMRKRVELGVSAFPMGPAADLPAEHHTSYEDAIRDAGREVGHALLERKRLAQAWGYFRMLDEPEPVRRALEAGEPDADDFYTWLDIAWQQQVHPRRGFDLMLARQGICSAITMTSSTDFSRNPELRTYCVKRLIRELYQQLHERILNDFRSRGVVFQESDTLGQLIASQEDLVPEEMYHVDVSHLASVVQMSLQVDGCEETHLAIQLCEYGERLSPNLQGDHHCPFEHGYSDFKRYLQILVNDHAEEHLKFFLDKLPQAAERGDLFPVEVIINLLVRLKRYPLALELSRRFLSHTEASELSCPSQTEIARLMHDYATVAEAARLAGDPVNFLAGLIEAQRKP